MLKKLTVPWQEEMDMLVRRATVILGVALLARKDVLAVM